MGEFVILVRDVEECFGGDASDVEAGSPESSSLLDTDGLHSELGSLDRSYISYVILDQPPGPPPMMARS